MSDIGFSAWLTSTAFVTATATWMIVGYLLYTIKKEDKE